MSRPGASGTPRKPRSRKQNKTCGERGRTFHTRSRIVRHELVHQAAEETGYSLAECEQVLAGFKQTGELLREHGGFGVKDNEAANE